MAMENIPRFKARDGDNWNVMNFDAYNMERRYQTLDEFFGLTELPELEDPNILSFATTENCNDATDDATYRLIRYLDDAHRLVDGRESAFDTFFQRLLETMGYSRGRRVIHTQYTYPFINSAEMKQARSDICVLDDTNKILLLVRRSKDGEDPLPSLVAAAIAAYQDCIQRRHSTLDEMVIPAIAFYGTWPQFYKIKVTEELNMSVLAGLRPTEPIVIPCQPVKHSPSTSKTMGMTALENRVIVLRYLEAFKAMVGQE